MGATFSPGTWPSTASAGGKAPNAFWWQCPCTCAVVDVSRQAMAGFSASRNSPIKKARAASASLAAPGSNARNSSRKVVMHEGSRPITGASDAESAARVRRASARALSTMPAAR